MYFRASELTSHFSRTKDKVVIVTGESNIKHAMAMNFFTEKKTGANSPNGIGRASAHQFAHNGAKAVYICDYDDTHLATHKREMESLYPGVDIHPRQFDAADEKAVVAVIDEALAKYGRIDVFFANAGIVGQPRMFTEIDAEGFMDTLKTNTVG